MSQSILPLNLFSLYPKTEWEKCLLDSITLIQSCWKPFNKLCKCSGSTEDRFFRGKKLLRSCEKVCSSSEGAVFEVFLLSWRTWLGDLYESAKDLSIEQMDELYRRCYLIDSLDIRSEEYPMGIVPGLLKISQWMPWLFNQGICVQSIEDPRDLQFGDFCRIQDGSSPKDGCTVIILGDGWERGQPVVYAWSSFGGYSQTWKYGVDMFPGHGCAYFKLRCSKDGFVRKFYGVRIVDDPIYRCGCLR